MATALKVHGIAYARAQGCEIIITRVRSNNCASLALNRKLGFRETGRGEVAPTDTLDTSARR